MKVGMDSTSQGGVLETASKAENDTKSNTSPSAAQHHFNESTNCSFNWANLPKPTLPPREKFHPIEKFVSDAIDSRHLNLPPTSPSKCEHMSSPSPSKSTPAAEGYKAILDLLRKKDDLPMLCKVFLALRTNGIEKFCSERSKHNRMIHYIFRLNPFDIRDRGAEVVQNHSLGIAYLNFVVALTSANSVFLTPTLNSLWRLLIATDAVTPNDKQLHLSKSNHNSSPEPTDESEQSTDPDDSNDAKITYQIEVNSLLHGALRKVIQLVPKGSTEIYPVIASSFPFKLAPLPNQVNYIKQCFIVLNYVPSMQRQFLELCVDKCLEIDVEIRIAKNGTVKIEEQGKDKDDEISIVLENDVSDHILDEDDVQQQNKLKEECLEKLKNQTEEEKVDEMADKLDTLMYLIFEHIGSMTKSKQKSARQLFNMLMPTFDSVILTTHRCKFVQFIIIFLCGLDKEGENKNEPTQQLDNGVQSFLFREFSAKLIDVVLDPFRATVTRQSAACYLASFASRAACVCPETACESVSALLRFAEAYMDAFPTEASARNARRYSGADSNCGQESTVSVHSLFYTICQASFYIMCFRGKECVEYHRKALEHHEHLQNNDSDEMPEYSDPQFVDITIKRWNRLCSHHLNPLKFCLESVRGEFLLLASHFDLLEENILQRMIIQDRKLASNTFAADDSSSTNRPKKRRRITTSIQTAATLERRRIAGGVGGLGKGSNPLDSFFPFDPYLLRRSYDFVEPHYRHWNGGCTVDDEEVDQSDEKQEKVSSENHDDYYDVSSVGGDESISQDSSFLSDDDDDDQEDDEEKEDQGGADDEEDKGLTAMSLASTTVSMGGSEWTDDLTDNENCFDRDTKETDVWVNELKRARAASAASIDDCW